MRIDLQLVWGPLCLRLIWRPLRVFHFGVNEYVDEDGAEARN